jgi:hypothetical protein
MRTLSFLFLCVILLCPEVAKATCSYDYGADEYVTIANGLSPNGKYAITAHGETVDGEMMGYNNFHIYLTDAVTGKKIGPLEEIVGTLDTCASRFCALWSDDSRHVTIIYSVSRHAPHKAVYYRIGHHRAFPLEGPVDATDEQMGYWENQCEVPQPSERIFGTGKSHKTP